MIKISYSARDLSLSECMRDKWKINICVLVFIFCYVLDYGNSPLYLAAVLGDETNTESWSRCRTWRALKT